jgi:VanZ family protein
LRIYILYFFISWIALMLYLLLFPGSVFKDFHFFEGEDKLAHFILFFVWTFSLNYLQLLKNKQSNLKGVTQILILGISFAALTEILQHFIPNRSMDLLDFLADTFGVLLALSLVTLLKNELIRIGYKLDK